LHVPRAADAFISMAGARRGERKGE
jgi:hypothetical protein